MKVKEVMTSVIKSTSEKDSLQNAAQIMQDVNVGVLPVRDDKNLLSGIITDRDIVVRATAEGLDPATTNVGGVMTRGAISCTADSDITDAARGMEENQIRRLIVLDEKNDAAGILSLGDIAVNVPAEPLVGEVLEDVSKPAKPAL